jgi:hypothetical protein
MSTQRHHQQIRKRFLLWSTYKDFAPTERDFPPLWSPFKVMAFALVTLFGFSGRSANGANGALTRPALVTDHPLDIRVQANVFGKASAADITMVLSSAALELFRYCPHSQLDGIDVYFRSDHPKIDLHRTRERRIAIGLSARDTHWAQYSFQFAHEFCHALANFSDHSSPGPANVPNPHLWLEESICETASLFVLRAMSRSWETNPPYPAWQAYAPWLNHYVERRLALPENRLGMSFAAWFRRNQTALQQEAGRRSWNIIIATQLLPIFEADPAGWEAVTFLNRGPCNGRQSLSEHFAQWRASCPDHIRPFVAKLAAVFGLSLP